MERRRIPVSWIWEGRNYAVAIEVEGDKVVGVTPTITEGGIFLPHKNYLGDYVKKGLAKVGVPDCPKILPGCGGRQAALNKFDRKVIRPVGRFARSIRRAR